MVLSWLQMAGFALIILTAGCGVQAPSTSENKQGQSVATFLRPICMSDDGRLLAIADNGGSIKIWDWQRRRVIISIDAETNAKKASDGSGGETKEGSSPSDGRLARVRKRASTFLTGASKRAISRVKGFFDQAAIERAFFDAPYDREAMTGAWIDFWKRSSFSPDNKYLALIGLDDVNLLATSDGSFEWRLGGGNGEALFSPDSKYMMSVSRDTADLWDLQEGRRLSILERSWSYPGESSIWPIGNGLYTAAFSARGTGVAVADRMEVHGNYGSATTERVRIWDLSTILAARPSASDTDWLRNILPARIDKTAPDATVSKVLFPEPFPRHPGDPFPQEAPYLLMTYSPEDRYLAAASSTELRIWDLQHEGKLRTISLASNRPVSPKNVRGPVTSLGFSQDGKLIGVGIANRVVVWNALNGSMQYSFEEDGNTWLSLHFQPSGEVIATELPYASSAIRIWDVKTHSVKAQIP